MLPPKKSNVGRTTRNTQNISAKRATETFEERDARREVERNRAESSRANEKFEEGDPQREVERTRQRGSKTTIDLFKAAFNYDQEYDYSVHRDVVIGSMTTLCIYCHALKFVKESPGMCCSNGKVKLSQLVEPPEPLISYLSGNTALCKHFLENIRKFNSLKNCRRI